MPGLPANEGYDEEILLSNTVGTSFAVCPASQPPLRQSLSFEPWLAVQLDDHYVPPAIVLPATPTMATRDEASSVIRLTVQMIAHTAGRLSMPGRCRHLRVLPSREAGEAPESEASRRLCLHYSCQIGRHWQCFGRTLLADTVALVGAGGGNQGG